MSAIVDEIWSSPEFTSGIRPGLAVSAAALLVGWIWRLRTEDPAPMVGVVFSIAAVVAFAAVRPLEFEVVAGMTVLGLAGLVFGPTAHIPALRLIATAPGAWLISRSIDSDLDWVMWLVFGVILFGAPLVAATDRHLAGSAFGPALFAITVAAVYADVPDTEEILVLLGVIAPLILAGWPLRLGILGSAGSHAAVGVLVWATAIGGRGRPASIVGGAACLGVLALVPIARRLRHISGPQARWPAILVIHLALVGLCSRIAGLRSDPVEAAFIATAVLGIGLVVLSLVLREPAGSNRPLAQRGGKAEGRQRVDRGLGPGRRDTP